MKYKFIAHATKWQDKTYGNTYHSVRIIKVSTGEIIYCPFQYGYGSHYQQTTLKAMKEKGWIKCDDVYLYERENNYPIYWICYYTTKKECKQHGVSS